MLLAGCSAEPTGVPTGQAPTSAAPAMPTRTPSPVAPPASTPPADLSADDVRRSTGPLLAGGPFVVAGTGTPLAHAVDGAVGTASWAPDPATPDDVALVAAPAGGSFEAQPDGSVLLLDADGSPVAALRVTGGHARLRSPDLLAVTADGPGDVTLVVGTQALARADWGEREGGRSLAVVPTPWARAAGDAALELLWHQATTAQPEAGTATMHDQLVCHALGAPDKDAWNLEPWRPDVGLLETLLARCNPA